MAFKMKGPTFFNVGKKYPKQNPSAVFQQTDDDLREFLLDEIFPTQEDANNAIQDGSWSTESKEFKEWYANKGGELAQDEPAPDVDEKSDIIKQGRVEGTTPLEHTINKQPMKEGWKTHNKRHANNPNYTHGKSYEK